MIISKKGQGKSVEYLRALSEKLDRIEQKIELLLSKKQKPGRPKKEEKKSDKTGRNFFGRDKD